MNVFFDSTPEPMLDYNLIANPRKGSGCFSSAAIIIFAMMLIEMAADYVALF
jgi:hypothetical protein